jgi:hypothetical protein
MCRRISSTEKPVRIALLPANPKNRPVLRRFETTIRSKVRFDDQRDLIDADVFADLSRIFPDGAARMWAVTPAVNGSNVGKWSKLSVGDPVAFCGDRRIYAVSRIELLFRNAVWAERLWGRDESNGLTWEYMFALGGLRTVAVPIEEVRPILGRKGEAIAQNFTIVEGSRAEDLADLINLEVTSVVDDDRPSPSPPAETDCARRADGRPSNVELASRAPNTEAPPGRPWRWQVRAMRPQLSAGVPDRCTHQEEVVLYRGGAPGLRQCRHARLHARL